MPPSRRAVCRHHRDELDEPVDVALVAGRA
jgi:hypothetical protein